MGNKAMSWDDFGEIVEQAIAEDHVYGCQEYFKKENR